MFAVKRDLAGKPLASKDVVVEAEGPSRKKALVDPQFLKRVANTSLWNALNAR